MGFLSPSDVPGAGLCRSTTLTQGGTLQRSDRCYGASCEDEDTVGTQVLRFRIWKGLVRGSQRQPYAVAVRLEFGADDGELSFSPGGAAARWVTVSNMPWRWHCKPGCSSKTMPAHQRLPTAA